MPQGSNLLGLCESKTNYSSSGLPFHPITFTLDWRGYHWLFCRIVCRVNGWSKISIHCSIFLFCSNKRILVGHNEADQIRSAVSRDIECDSIVYWIYQLLIWTPFFRLYIVPLKITPSGITVVSHQLLLAVRGPCTFVCPKRSSFTHLLFRLNLLSLISHGTSIHQFFVWDGRSNHDCSW